MAKFKMQELIVNEPITARLGAGSGSANYVTDVEIGKAVKFIADSQYNLCAAGDLIEGFVTAVESYTADDFSIGSVQIEGRKRVILDGLQATPGTGTCAVGDLVVAGSATVKGTALSSFCPKVCKATSQAVSLHNWRIVSLEGTGAVGQFATIERLKG